MVANLHASPTLPVIRRTIDNSIRRYIILYIVKYMSAVISKKKEDGFRLTILWTGRIQVEPFF